MSGSWRRLVFANPDLAEGVVDHRAYALCVLERLYLSLRRCDVYAAGGSRRWGDPRARLLDGNAWEQTRPQVLTALRLTEPAETHLTDLAGRLDAAYTGLAARLGPPDERGKDAAVRLEPGADGRVRLHLARLEALDEPPTLLALRELVARMLPRVDLPEVLLEVDAWTGYLSEFSHVAEFGTRMQDLATSLAAVLVAEGCNLGLAPVVKPGHPALTRDRLSHVGQNYLRTDTLSAANARLIEAQAGIGVAQLWGGGLIASVDGLRFVVPVRTLNAGPNPRYFGQERGVTYYNLTSDQFTGLGGIVVPGTLRDSLVLLSVLLEQETLLQPTEVMTDTGAYTDVMFGIFHLLGFQFSPRLADIGGARFWCVDPNADYGALNGLARHRAKMPLVVQNWDDLLRLAGSLKLGLVQAGGLIRTLQTNDRPTKLARALEEWGRVVKSLYLLSYIDDESYRRRILVQLNRGEGRHQLARAVFHGKRGELRQRYREGQEDQLGALGLVVNVIVLWNTLYMDAALDQLRAEDYQVRDEDVARLSPLGFEHINMLGRYAFTLPDAVARGELRPLRNPASAGEEPDEPALT